MPIKVVNKSQLTCRIFSTLPRAWKASSKYYLFYLGFFFYGGKSKGIKGSDSDTADALLGEQMCGAVGCGAVRFDEGSVLGSPAWCVQLSAHPPQTPFLLASDKCGHPSGFHINTARERVNCSYPPIKKKRPYVSSGRLM